MPSARFAGSLVRQFRFRQKVELTDRLEAAAGMLYDLKSSRVGPTASLIYRLDKDHPKSRIELSSLDKRLLLRKGWEVGVVLAGTGHACMTHVGSLVLADAGSLRCTHISC